MFDSLKNVFFLNQPEEELINFFNGLNTIMTELSSTITPKPQLSEAGKPVQNKFSLTFYLK